MHKLWAPLLGAPRVEDGLNDPHRVRRPAGIQPSRAREVSRHSASSDASDSPPLLFPSALASPRRNSGLPCLGRPALCLLCLPLLSPLNWPVPTRPPRLTASRVTGGSGGAQVNSAAATLREVASTSALPLFHEWLEARTQPGCTDGHCRWAGFGVRVLVSSAPGRHSLCGFCPGARRTLSHLSVTLTL